MFSKEDEGKFRDALKKYNSRWIWIDVTTTLGPTSLENYFKSIFSGDFLHHWSPTCPEGYLEIKNDKNIVVHWILGEKNEIIAISPQEDVDFDKIDDALASTIIQNSVIRIFSEKY